MFVNGLKVREKTKISMGKRTPRHPELFNEQTCLQSPMVHNIIVYCKIQQLTFIIITLNDQEKSEYTKQNLYLGDFQ